MRAKRKRGSAQPKLRKLGVTLLLELVYCWPHCRCGHITHFRPSSTSISH